VTDTVDASVLSGPCIKLDLTIDPSGQSETIVPYSWCFTNEGYNYLEAHPPTKPLWLVVVDRMSAESVVHARYEQRFVHPIEKQNSGIGFLWAGDHRLTAFVVSGDEKDVRKCFLDERSRFDYTTRLFRQYYVPESGEGQENWPEFIASNFEDHIDDYGPSPFYGITLIGEPVNVNVSVDKRMFARRPKGWRVNYLLRLFSQKPDNICDNRKRWGAYALLLLWVPFGLLARTGALLFSLLLSGRARWREFPKLFAGHVKSIIVDPGDIEGFNWYKIPGLYLVVALVLWVISLDPGAAIPLVSCFVLGCAFLALCSVVDWLRARRQARKLAPKPAPAVYVPPMRTYAAMACSKDAPRTVTVKPQAKRRWRVTMAFWKIKAKRCKSYEVV
jgi:hypothetical protein